LYPVFLKLEKLRVLLVGGGIVGYEKLTSVLSNSPGTAITIIAPVIRNEIKELINRHQACTIIQRNFEDTDLENVEIVICATDNKELHKRIKQLANDKKLLVNVADTPELCDFYLGSIVQKGNLKIAISTNGKSPTVAKRIKEVISELIPAKIDNVLDDMQVIRQSINGSFVEKVTQLNDITKVLVAKHTTLEKINEPAQKKWPRIVMWCVLAFFFMIVGHAFFTYMPFNKIKEGLISIASQVDTTTFLFFLFTGFIAQMADGSLGMGYGTISTTALLAYGVPPAIVSSRVHSARVFSSGVSGYSHHRFGNINKKLFKTLVIPGVMGAAIGAALAFYGQKYSGWLRIPLSVYTIYLGYYIIRKAFARKKKMEKVKGAGWLASVGGFMDAFAGGGWGTLVTSTLMSKRRSPRYVIGSVCLAEFFVVLTSSITFFILLKSIPIIDVAGLIVGGVIAAPIAARLVGKLPLKTMFIAIGTLVIITSGSTLWKAVAQLLR
jgi:siroheme synthase-like protein